jgi:uncharacterized protein
VQIQIDKLKRRPRQITIDEPAADFPILNELAAQGTVIFDQQVTGSLEATWAGDVIEVAGYLSTTVTLPCGRCLMPVTGKLNIPVALCYSEADDNLVAPDVEKLEIRHEELGLIFFTGPEIELRPDLEQEVLMALPQQPLCRETCRGLCPICGINLSLESCHCIPPVFHTGLAALENYKVK